MPDSFARSQARCYLVMAALVLAGLSCTTGLELPAASEPQITLTPPPGTETAPAEFSGSLGLNPQFATRLKSEGINSTISGQESNWQISRIISRWNQDGTPIVENNVKIVSLESASVHNAGYPDGILKGVDSQGKTVFWSESEKSWVRPLEISNDIENPTSFPWGKEYLAIETVLLNSNLNKPFSDEVVKNFKGGWAMNFQYDEKTKSSYAYLTPYNIDSQSIRWVLDESGKPIWFTTTSPDGTVYQSVATQLLNPADPTHPKADETMFVLTTAGEWWSNEKPNYIRTVFQDNYMTKKNNFTSTLLPLIEIAQRGNYFTQYYFGVLSNRPSLDSLLGQQDNDLNNIAGVTPYLNHLNEVGLLNENGEVISIKACGVGHFDKQNNFVFDPLFIDLQSYLLPLLFTINQ